MRQRWRFAGLNGLAVVYLACGGDGAAPGGAADGAADGWPARRGRGRRPAIGPRQPGRGRSKRRRISCRWGTSCPSGDLRERCFGWHSVRGPAGRRARAADRRPRTHLGAVSPDQLLRLLLARATSSHRGWRRGRRAHFTHPRRQAAHQGPVLVVDGRHGRGGGLPGALWPGLRWDDGRWRGQGGQYSNREREPGGAGPGSVSGGYDAGRSWCWSQDHRRFPHRLHASAGRHGGSLVRPCPRRWR